jgi:hypothetical protein
MKTTRDGSTRLKREAEALRENLARRKAQSRTRKAPGPPEFSAPETQHRIPQPQRVEEPECP